MCKDINDKLLSAAIVFPFFHVLKVIICNLLLNRGMTEMPNQGFTEYFKKVVKTMLEKQGML